MKIQTTKKAIRANFGIVVVVSVPQDVWADVADALRLTPSAYIVGVYGHTDVYTIGDVAVTVTTGGRSLCMVYSRDRLSMWLDVARLARTADEIHSVTAALAADIQGHDPLILHHTSLARGYVSRRGTGRMEAYKGRFGIGVTYHAPSHGMTSYHPVSYYVL